MPNRARLCENCGGKLQVAHTWQSMVVCGTCHAQLSSPVPIAPPEPATPSKGRGSWIIAASAALAAVALTGGVLVRQIVTQRNARIAEANRSAVADQSSRPSDEGSPLHGALLVPRDQPAPMATVTARVEALAAANTESAPGRIEGRVFFLTRDGLSEPQGGLKIELIRKIVRGSVVRTALTAEAKTWRDLVQASSPTINDATASRTSGTDSGTGSDSGGAFDTSGAFDATGAYDAGGAFDAADSRNTAASENATTVDVTNASEAVNSSQTANTSDSGTASEAQEIAAAAESALSRVDSQLEKPSSDMDAGAAFKLLGDLALFHIAHFDDVLTDGEVARATTNDDGSYAMPDIAPGDYYLYAAAGPLTSRTEWCIPVHVGTTGETLQLDLREDNATVSRGK